MEPSSGRLGRGKDKSVHSKQHLESVIDMVLPREHPILQWFAWCTASLLDRVSINSHGRAVSEYAIGHCTKAQLSCFGEAMLWRAKRHVGALDKYVRGHVQIKQTVWVGGCG